MRDISEKFSTLRVATARATLRLAPATVQRLAAGDLPKGDALGLARVAAVQAAKNTAQLIPYCHPLLLDHVAVDFNLGADRVDVQVTVKAVHRTGVEMEALTGATLAALTLYDMTKMLDEHMEITGVTLLEKRGGKSDHPGRAGGRQAAVLVISDSVAEGRAADRSGALLAERLGAAGFEVVRSEVCADEPAAIEARLIEYADRLRVDVVLTTGGTGLGPRDHTPEATAKVIERDLGGVIAALQSHGRQRIPTAMLSRARAGVRGRTMIVNLPGSPRACEQSLPSLLAVLPHAFEMIEGGGH